MSDPTTSNSSSRQRLVLVFLALSLLINAVMIIAVWRVAASRGGWPWVMGKMGLSQNHYAPSYWNDDRAAVFRLVPATDHAIVFAGDSLTAGFPWAEAFPHHVVRNRGIDGNTTADLHKRLGDITSQKPDALFILIGVNDLLLGHAPTAVTQRIERILADVQSQSPGTKVYLQSLTPIAASTHASRRHLTGQIVALNAELEALAGRSGVTFVDLYPLFADEAGYLRTEFARDDIHLNAKAYAVWRNAVTPWVDEARKRVGEENAPPSR